MMNNLRHFKLIDKKGYFGSAPANKQLFETFSEDGVYSGFIDYSNLVIDDSVLELISKFEFKYFEEVFLENQESTDFYATDTSSVVSKLTGKDLESTIKDQAARI